MRRERLDHLLILTEGQLRRVLTAYVAYFNRARPHQGCGQRVPVPVVPPGPARYDADEFIAIPVLGELHHAYRVWCLYSRATMIRPRMRGLPTVHRVYGRQAGKW